LELGGNWDSFLALSLAFGPPPTSDLAKLALLLRLFLLSAEESAWNVLSSLLVLLSALVFLLGLFSSLSLSLSLSLLSLFPSLLACLLAFLPPSVSFFLSLSLSFSTTNTLTTNNTLTTTNSISRPVYLPAYLQLIDCL